MGVTDEGEVEFIQMAELSQGESTSAAGLDIKSVSEATISTALNMQTNKPDLQTKTASQIPNLMVCSMRHSLQSVMSGFTVAQLDD